MSAKDKTAWFWSDWAGDLAVRRLTPAERGVWIDLLALAFNGHPKGYVTDASGKPLSHAEIARFTNCASPVEVAKLIDGILKAGAAQRDRSGRLFNRRMVRDGDLSAKRQRAGQSGGTSTALKWHKYWGLVQQNPQQMPQQNRSASLPKKEITTTVTGAEEGAADAERVASPRPVSQPSAIEVTPELARINQRKGWTR